MLRDKVGTSDDGRLAQFARRSVASCAMAVAAVLLFVQTWSCAGPPDRRPPVSAVRPSPTPRLATQASPAKAPVRAPISALAVISVRDVLFREDLLHDVPSKLPESEIGATKIPVTKGAWVALDDHPPRQSEGDSLRLRDLLSEDHEIAPGPHVLTVFLVDEKSLHVQVRSFLAGTDAEQDGRPGCVLWTGPLTFNGPEQIANMSALAIPTDPLVSHLQYEVKNEAGQTVARSSSKLMVGEAASLPSPLSGDIQWSVSCFVRTKQVGASHRLVTFNPESIPVETK